VETLGDIEKGVDMMNSYYDLYGNDFGLFNMNFMSKEELLVDSIFVLDTNVLLLPYKVGSKELEEIERIYKILIEQGKLSIPSRVAKEFVKNRPNKLAELHQTISNDLSAISKIKIKKYPVLSQVESYMVATELVKEINDQIDNYKKMISETITYIKDLNWNDPVSYVYSEIFSEEIICSISEDISEVENELANRHKFGIPPGNKDKSKDDKGIGDFLIWKSMIELAKAKNSNIVFVTVDEKNDWFHQSMNAKLYPRYELLYEFHSKTEGKHITFINLSELIDNYTSNKEVVESIRTSEKETRYCVYCNIKESENNKLLLEHFVPVSLGGTDSPDNLINICSACSKSRSNNTFDPILDYINKNSRPIELGSTDSTTMLQSQYLYKNCPYCRVGVITMGEEGLECSNCDHFRV